MDRNKLDPGPTLAEVLAGGDLYGQNYVDPRLGMDSADYGTQNVLGLMGARQAAKEREPYEALTRLFTTAAAPMAAAHNASGNLPKAIARHIAQERKEGNPFLGPMGLLGAGAYGVGVPMAVNEWLASGNPWPGVLMGTGALVTGALGAKNHVSATARILEHLNRTEPRTKTLY